MSTVTNRPNLTNAIDDLIDYSREKEVEILEYEAFKILNNCYESLYELLTCTEKDLSNSEFKLSELQKIYSIELLKQALEIAKVKELSSVYTVSIDDYSRLQASLNFLCDFLVKERDDLANFNFDKFLSEVIYTVSNFTDKENMIVIIEEFNEDLKNNNNEK